MKQWLERKHGSTRIIVFTLLMTMLAWLIPMNIGVAKAAEGDAKIPVNEGCYLLFDKATGEITGYEGDIRDVTIPEAFNGKKITSIGSYAFNWCKSLISVTIPNSIISIRESAFAGCSSLTGVSVPDSVTSIGHAAFNYCGSLTSVSIPDSVTSIGNDTFGNCSSLTYITVDAGNQNYSSLEGVLFSKDKTELLQYPAGNKATSYEIPNSVISIEDYAFYGCSGLSSVAIPDSVMSIGENAFLSCENLISVVIPESVTRIERYAFESCNRLTNITIPNSVTSIGYGAFVGCRSLKDITIPDSITSIEGCMFSHCLNLSNITIPDSVTSIGESAFWACERLTDIMLSDNVTSIGKGAFHGCKAFTSVTIPDGIASIEESTFAFCTNLSSIAIPDSVTSIGENAFCGCENLTNIRIPDGVTSLGLGTFCDCKRLSGLVIPDSVTNIGNGAFIECESLSGITIPSSVVSIYDECGLGYTYVTNNGVTSKAKIEDFIIQGYSATAAEEYAKKHEFKFILLDFEPSTNPTDPSISSTEPTKIPVAGGGYLLFNKETGAITGYEGIIKDVTIPETFGGKRITSIGQRSFLDCALTSVTIPNSVTAIGDEAFGYQWDKGPVKVPGFKIYGYSNDSVAAKYAKENDFEYIVINAENPDDGDGLFKEENESTEEVVTPPEAAEVPEEDRITSITINPAFNMKNKEDNNVEIDLSKIKIKASAIYDKEGLKRAEAALGEALNGGKHYNLLDLTLLYDGKDFSNGYEGLVKVIIPLPKGHKDKTFSCYRITDAGDKELIPGEQTEDSYIIYLEHFSVYALVAAEPGGEHTHNYSTDWKSDATGHWKECATCKDKTEESIHMQDAGTVTKAATKTEPGIKTYKCSICGYAIKTEEIAKLPADGKSINKKTSAATKITKKQQKKNGVILNKKVSSKISGDSLTVTWNKLKNADGYDIYAAPCDNNFKKITLSVGKNKTSAAIRKINGKRINKKKPYKVKVKAYRLLSNGEKQYLGVSATMHVIGNLNKTTTNAKDISLKKKAHVLKKGKSAQIRATIIKADKKKRLLSREHGARLSYVSSNDAIATVTATGKIKAKKRGKCTIYVRALNGVSKKIKVTVN